MLHMAIETSIQVLSENMLINLEIGLSLPQQPCIGCSIKLFFQSMISQVSFFNSYVTACLRIRSYKARAADRG